MIKYNVIVLYLAHHKCAKYRTITFGTVHAKNCHTDILLKVSLLNRYTFRAIDFEFLFLKLRTSPFLYVKLYFGVLHKHSADVMSSDTHWFQNLHILIQMGAFESLKIRCVSRGVLSLLNLFCSLNCYSIRYEDTAVQS